MKIMMILPALLLGSHAFAGDGTCAVNLNLKCEIVYNHVNGPATKGPSAIANVADIQPEPFDPTECEGAVVLYTDVDKMIATYNDENHTLNVLLETPARHLGKYMIGNAPLSTKQSVSAHMPTPESIYPSLELSCNVIDSN